MGRRISGLSVVRVVAALLALLAPVATQAAPGVTERAVTPAGGGGSSPLWLKVANLPVSRSYLAVVTSPPRAADAGNIYVLGGSSCPTFGTGGCGTPTNTVEVYDPHIGWTTSAPLLTARFGDAAAASGKSLYAIGGYGAGGDLTSVEKYTPDSPPWHQVAPMSVGRYMPAAVTARNGTIYVMGGVNTAVLNSVEMYTPAKNHWTMVAPMPTAAYGLAAALGSDGLIYAMGGCLDVACSQLSSTVQVYDPAHNTWTLTTSLPVRSSFQAAVTGADGRIYAIGGATMASKPSISPTSGSGATNAVYMYTPATHTWAIASSLTYNRYALGAALGYDGRIYAIGGIGGAGSAVRQTEAYGPAITLTPAMGKSGSKAVVGGSNFAPSATVNVYWGATTKGTPLAHGSTDNTGTLTAPIPFVIPAGAKAGRSYPVTVVDTVSTYPVHLLFMVMP